MNDDYLPESNKIEYGVTDEDYLQYLLYINGEL